jgi:hypothetical protein
MSSLQPHPLSTDAKPSSHRTLTHPTSIWILMFAVFICGSCQPVNEPVRTILVIFDGVRPDYITAETMPNLYALSREGSYGKRQHSVYPTVTRVNASSYATGTYPATHGILGTTVYFPSILSRQRHPKGIRLLQRPPPRPPQRHPHQ